MNTQPKAERNRAGSADAFTMVEVALSLGIIAFALVAIIGVLPSGMKVQRENREETIVYQDSEYLLEGIRSGAKGLDDLTNYVESITIQSGNGRPRTYTNNVFNPGGFLPLTNGLQIISLLTTPKVEWFNNNTYQINKVTAQMRSISGRALDQSPSMRDFAFRYQLTAEVIAVTNVPPLTSTGLSRTEALRTLNLLQNLYEVRLTTRWPLVQRANTWGVGRYRRTASTLVSGELAPLWTNSLPHFYLFQPDTFASYH